MSKRTSKISANQPEVVAQSERRERHEDTPRKEDAPDKSPEYVTKKELATRYSVTLGTINNWMREGRIPFLRLSRQLVRFNLKDCDAAIKRYQVRARQ